MSVPLKKNDFGLSRKVVFLNQTCILKSLGCEKERTDYPGSLIVNQRRNKSSSCIALYDVANSQKKKEKFLQYFLSFWSLSLDSQFYEGHIL